MNASLTTHSTQKNFSYFGRNYSPIYGHIAIPQSTKCRSNRHRLTRKHYLLIFEKIQAVRTEQILKDAAPPSPPRRSSQSAANSMTVRTRRKLSHAPKQRPQPRSGYTTAAMSDFFVSAAWLHPSGAGCVWEPSGSPDPVPDMPTRTVPLTHIGVWAR